MNIKNNQTNRANPDKDYIIKLIQFLQLKYSIIFFISTKDFDILYNWWEKRIPLPIVKDSIATVVKRREEKKGKITGFSCFAYEVRKNFNAFLQLKAGGDPVMTEPKTQIQDEINDMNEINETPSPFERFFTDFPFELNPLRDDFDLLYRDMKIDIENRTASLFDKLLVLFQDDSELNIKTEIFLKNIAPTLRKPEIENRYRLNYLLNKFSIPDFAEFTT